MNVPPSYQMPPPSDAPAPPQKSGVPGWAKWAIGCGAMVMCCCPVGGGILFPVFAQAKVAAQTTTSLAHLRDLSSAMHEYATDNDDRTCPIEGWNANVSGYGDAFSLADPLVKDQLGYGLNPGVCSISESAIEDMSKVIQFGTSTQEGPDTVLTPETLRKVSRPPFRTLWVTVDGQAKKALIDEAQRLQWKPVQKKK
ncbi:MAG: hypothetical protein WCK51_00165 [Armatimonadota bacterium]